MYFTVIYEINVIAKSELDAALQVEKYMREGYYRPSLIVRNNETNISSIIDLEELEVEE